MCGRVVRAGLIFAWGDGDDATGDRPARKTARVNRESLGVGL